MRNYRSHASLLQVPNQLFYEDRLEAAAAQDALLAPPAWGQLRISSGASSSALFINMCPELGHPASACATWAPCLGVCPNPVSVAMLHGAISLRTSTSS